MLPAAMAGLLLVLGAAIVFAVMVLPQGERKALAGRIDRAIGPQLAQTGVQRRAAVPWWVTRSGRYVRQLFTLRLGRGWGVTIRTWNLAAIGLVAAVAIATLCRAFVPLPLWLTAVLSLVGLLGLPRMIALRQHRRALAAFDTLFPDTMDMVVRMIRAGLPIGAAVRAVGDQEMPPVSDVFRQVADQTTIGVPLEEALASSAAGVGAPDYSFFAVAVALQRSTGGNLAVTLATLADIIRKRRAMRLKAKATTAEVRLSAYVLGGIPFLVTAGLTLLAPNYLEPLISDPSGNWIGISANGSLLLAFLTMRWLTRRTAT
jgi:tight adherence protein B